MLKAEISRPVASRAAVLLLTCLMGSTLVHAKEPAPSDADVRKAIIQESIAAYPGPCACPYSSARNGSRCGRRSAYSRPGGYSPLCYDRDVSDEQVKAYRQEHGVAGQ